MAFISISTSKTAAAFKLAVVLTIIALALFPTDLAAQGQPVQNGPMLPLNLQVMSLSTWFRHSTSAPHSRRASTTTQSLADGNVAVRTRVSPWRRSADRTRLRANSLLYHDSLRTREVLDGVARIDSARAHDSGRLPF
jgi:hypothetical protein